MPSRQQSTLTKSALDAQSFVADPGTTPTGAQNRLGGGAGHRRAPHRPRCSRPGSTTTGTARPRRVIGYEPDAAGAALVDLGLAEPLSVEGELTKVAANIAIGRKWAGVHYCTDYVESFRLGEQIAVGLPEEQKLTHGENFSMTVPLSDASSIRI